LRDEYKMIQWYSATSYWLIPANRHYSILWYALSDMVKWSRFSEELGRAKTRNYKDFRRPLLLHGQLVMPSAWRKDIARSTR
jgi:hypothetical protein